MHMPNQCSQHIQVSSQLTTKGCKLLWVTAVAGLSQICSLMTRSTYWEVKCHRQRASKCSEMTPPMHSTVRIIVDFDGDQM